MTRDDLELLEPAGPGGLEPAGPRGLEHVVATEAGGVDAVD